MPVCVNQARHDGPAAHSVFAALPISTLFAADVIYLAASGEAERPARSALTACKKALNMPVPRARLPRWAKVETTPEPPWPCSTN